ncbi:MAG: DinB family protein [Actinomycetota bacterium]
MSDGLLARETAAYAAFEEAVAAVPPERREEPSLPEGWSVKDVLWHVAYWWRDGEESFRAIGAGTHVDEEWPAEKTDATNARALAASRVMSIGDVEAELSAARASMLEAFAPVAGDPVADELFTSETIDHYEEHLAGLRGLGTS